MNKHVAITIFLICTALLLCACCRDARSSQIVDVGPLYELVINPDIDMSARLAKLDIFDEYDRIAAGGFGGQIYSQAGSHFATTYVYLWPLFSLERARSMFELECENQGFEDTSGFIYGGEADNRYCISYVGEGRDPEALCRKTGRYSSFVVFQKEKLVVVVYEISAVANSGLKDDVIKALAQEFSD